MLVCWLPDGRIGSRNIDFSLTTIPHAVKAHCVCGGATVRFAVGTWNSP
jgi:hypothetical protein